ncbi:MAG: cell division protein FtsQ, partial [Megasphaera micronuciformis]|nr:cell division protein FtsQ [Megasphaera micronuciformis]
MEKHHLDGQPEEARFYIPEGADNKGVQFGLEGEMPLTAAQEKIEQRRKKRQRREEGRRRRRKRLQVIGAVAGVFGLWLLLRFLPVPFGSVVIEGNGTMPDEDVLRVAGVPSYVNVVQLSTSTMRERLVRDLRVGE